MSTRRCVMVSVLLVAGLLTLSWVAKKNDDSNNTSRSRDRDDSQRECGGMGMDNLNPMTLPLSMINELTSFGQRRGYEGNCSRRTSTRQTDSFNSTVNDNVNKIFDRADEIGRRADRIGGIDRRGGHRSGR